MYYKKSFENLVFFIQSADNFVGPFYIFYYLLPWLNEGLSCEMILQLSRSAIDWRDAY